MHCAHGCLTSEGWRDPIDIMDATGLVRCASGPEPPGPSGYVVLKAAATWLRIWAAVPCLEVDEEITVKQARLSHVVHESLFLQLCFLSHIFDLCTKQI